MLYPMICPWPIQNGQINDIPALVQIMACRRPGEKPLSEPMMARLLMHICASRPQIVKSGRLGDAYINQRIRPSLIWIMTCRLFNDKPSSLQWEDGYFLFFIRCIEKWLLQNVDYFVPILMCHNVASQNLIKMCPVRVMPCQCGISCGL